MSEAIKILLGIGEDLIEDIIDKIEFETGCYTVLKRLYRITRSCKSLADIIRPRLSRLKQRRRVWRIVSHGSGGELTVGTVSRAFVQYWQERDDLADYVFSFDRAEEEKQLGIEDDDARLDPDSTWDEMDDVEHFNAAYSDHSSLCVDEIDPETRRFTGGESAEFNAADYVTDECEDSLFLERLDSDDDDGPDDRLPVLISHSYEKGSFVSWFALSFDDDFDSEKLGITIRETEMGAFIEGVKYNGEELETGDGGDTMGKGVFASVGWLAPRESLALSMAPLARR